MERDPRPGTDTAWLEAGLQGVRGELTRLKVPRAIERELRAQMRAGRLVAAPLPVWRMLTQQFLVPALAISVVLALFIPFLLPAGLAPELTGEGGLQAATMTPFYAFAHDGGATDASQGVIVATELPREALLEFGLPVDPGRLLEPVKADVLVGSGGEILAVRFSNDKGEGK